jgi:hypothetical protein
MADINFSIPVCLSKATQDWQENHEIFGSRQQRAWRTFGRLRFLKSLHLIIDGVAGRNHFPILATLGNRF